MELVDYVIRKMIMGMQSSGQGTNDPDSPRLLGSAFAALSRIGDRPPRQAANAGVIQAPLGAGRVM